MHEGSRGWDLETRDATLRVLHLIVSPQSASIAFSIDQLKDTKEKETPQNCIVFSRLGGTSRVVELQLSIENDY